jgi:hypothetical protein
MDTPSNPAYYPSTESERFFRKKHTVTVAFSIGVLLFLLPFAEIRCNYVALAKNTGLGIAAGTQWKSSVFSGMQDTMKSFDSENGAKKTEDDKKLEKELSMGPNIFALIALLTGIGGVLMALGNSKYRSLICMCTGILGAVMLIALMIQLQWQLKSQLPSGKGKGDDHLGLNMNMLLKLQFTIWYYISLVSFIVAAFFGFKHHRFEFDDALRTGHQFEFQRESTG